MLEFKAKPTGDQECFCWDITKEEYIKVFGTASWDEEMGWHKDLYESGWHTLGVNRPQWKEPETIRIYPDQIFNQSLGGETKQRELIFRIEVLECAK